MDFIFQNTVDLSGIFGEYIIHNLIDKVLKIGKSTTGDSKKETEHIELLIKNHFVQVYNWSNNVELFGLQKPFRTNEITLELSITTNIKKFNSTDSPNSVITEIDILKSNNNFLILGDPGAGKTTTLKRLVSKVIHSSIEDLNKKFPLLIKLKELVVGDSLFKRICDMVGLSYRRVDEKIKIGEQEIILIKYYVGEVLIEDAVCNFLNEAEIILIIDGFDEVAKDIKDSITKEIELISEKQSSSSSTLISCRSGDYHKTLRYFSICQVRPLSDKQIKLIAKKWTKQSDIFFKKLSVKPYKELVNRPLFLGQLLIIFIRKGEIPNTASDVYDKIVALLIKNWDFERGDIIRKSNYANFDNDEKQKFLEELSYTLLFEIKSKVFNRDIFKRAYLKMYKSYDLPKEEWELVANEIESHNGLIIKSGDDHYEFSHLVLQEYLCAKYLITVPLMPRLYYNYLLEYPAPLAICVSISRDPSSWFANFILRTFQKTKFPNKTSEERSIKSFISRVIFEKPKFQDNNFEMGMAIIYLIINFAYNFDEAGKLDKNGICYEIIDEFIKVENVELNLVHALSLFRIYQASIDSKKNYIEITIVENTVFDNSLNVPEKCLFPLSKFKELLSKNKILKYEIGVDLSNY